MVLSSVNASHKASIIIQYLYSITQKNGHNNLFSPPSLTGDLRIFSSVNVCIRVCTETNKMASCEVVAFVSFISCCYFFFFFFRLKICQGIRETSSEASGSRKRRAIRRGTPINVPVSRKKRATLAPGQSSKRPEKYKQWEDVSMLGALKAVSQGMWTNCHTSSCYHFCYHASSCYHFCLRASSCCHSSRHASSFHLFKLLHISNSQFKDVVIHNRKF